MGRWRADTVGSLVSHHETVTMSIDERPFYRVGSKRWHCSCGVMGQWSGNSRYYLVKLWERHVKKWHPEVEEL